jgi:4a-hydroxytetrahydrobiopterin dehydratase
MVDEGIDRMIAARAPGWKLQDAALEGRWAYADFAAAFAAAARVAMLAERADHHPDVLIGWGRLEVKLTTHSAGGVTDKDVFLAEMIAGVLGSPQG